MPITEDEILEYMRGILDRIDGSRAEHHKRLGPHSTIDELGCDSVTTLEMITDLEAFAGVEIPDEDLLQVRTIGDLVALIGRERGERQ